MIPQEAVVTYNKATDLLNKLKYERAIPIFKKALALGGSFKEAWVNLGNCYRFLDRDTMAVECYLKANHPDTPWLDGHKSETYNLALNNLGLLAFCFGRDDEAIKYYDIALGQDSEFYDAGWNKATAVLRKACSGQPELFAQGWELYENRFRKTPPVTLKNDKENLYPWMGSHVPSLVVMAEQGMGDNIMWARYLPLLRSRCDKLWVQADESIGQVFRSAGYNTCFHISETDATHGVPMCSLSRFFTHIPSEKWITQEYTAHEFPESDKPNIGIVFSGSTGHANDRNRSVNVHRYHKLAKYANLYCLSPGFTGNKYVKKLNISNWEDTIKYLLGLDLVITIDTSLAHMAGTLGVDTWMIQPLKETDFRWGTHTTGDNCWYESVKIIRNPNSWDHVFNELEDRLKEKYYV